MRRLPALFLLRKKPLALCLAALLALTAVALLVFPGAKMFQRAGPAADPKLSTPALALQALTAKNLYYNGEAIRWLTALRPELLDSAAKDPERVRAMVQAVQNPHLFRQLDRRYRFEALLLVGDPSQSRPLLDHLLETKDWTLTYLDHTSMVFGRGVPSPWSPQALSPIGENFHDPAAKALFLSQAATKMLAVRLPKEAKAVLDQARQLHADTAELWNALSIYHSGRGEWAAALADADRALALDADFLPALATKTQVLFATKKFDDALNLSTRLIEARPDDPGLLFYHAKIAHQRHAFDAEIRVLDHLVDLAEKDARPSSGYRIYLGQAYGAKGEAKPAIDQFTRALADPALSAEQRKFTSELLAQIKSRSGG